MSISADPALRLPAEASSPEAEADWLRRTLEALAAEKRRGWVVLDAPLASPERALALGTVGQRWIWAPPSGPTVVGLSAAEILSESGESRFAALEARAQATLQRLLVCESPKLRLASGLDAKLRAVPRFFAGFSFQAGTASDSPWAAFGDARGVLPRESYWRDGDSARLAAVIEPESIATRSAREHELERLLSLRGRFERVPTSTSVRAIAQCALSVDDPDRPRFEKLVASARDRIVSGELEKVVLARDVTLELDRAPDLVSVLEALLDEAPESTRFLLESGDRAFIGASPELLVKRLGERVETEAVAGTIDAHLDRAAEQLLASKKDLGEHQLVVRELTRTLEPVTKKLDVPSQPVTRALRHMLHLFTPISGTLNEPLHVLSLVARLHPTPAVAGIPTARALGVILGEERTGRGLYAGPIGWFDGNGDGEFVVALRSALLHQKQARLYAGAGIVRDSSPEREFEETRLKLLRMLGALGVDF